jgi:hypothetical protein
MLIFFAQHAKVSVGTYWRDSGLRVWRSRDKMVARGTRHKSMLSRREPRLVLAGACPL